MQTKITKRVVDATEPGPKDQFLWDTEVKGFGLKVTPAGNKVYVLQYRPRGAGRSAAPKRYTIGKHGSPWTPDTARGEARILLGQLEEGADPQKQKRAEREAAEQALTTTFTQLADRFIERHAKPKTRSWETTKRRLDLHVIPHWGKRPAAEITRRDVNALLNDIVAAGTPVLANRVLAAIRKLFGWAVEEDELPASPCVGVKPKAKEQDRDRVLSEAELVEVWRATGKLSDPFGQFVRMLILTAQRRDEVAGMCWSEIDLGARTWTIPKERAKNGKAHEVPLSDQAMEILESIPRVEIKPGDPSPYVFTTTGRTHISGYSRCKAILDRLVLDARRKAGAEEGLPAEKVQPPPHWTIHDVRRSVATGLAQMGFPPHVVDKILNHVSGDIKGVAAIYNRWEYLEERRTALDAWGKKVDRIVNGTPDNVVELRPAVA